MPFKDTYFYFHHLSFFCKVAAIFPTNNGIANMGDDDDAVADDVGELLLLLL